MLPWCPASPAGCWYRRSRRRRRPDRCEKAPRRQPATVRVGFPGRCPTARRLWGSWCGRSRRSRASPSRQLVRIALCLCDPRLDKLRGVNCGPVSQTRVCEPLQQGRFIHTDCFGSDQKLVRQGTLSPEQSEGTDQGPFPWPTAKPERAAAGVHQDRKVEGSEPAQVGQAPGGQPLDHPTS